MSKIIDLTGEKFNHLTVIERGPNTSHGLAQWWCKCDCGNKCLVRGSCLRNGHTQSCGCLQKQIAGKIGKTTIYKSCAGHNFIDLTGRKFGKLTVLNREENYPSGKVKWKCLCDCGNITYVNSWDLTSNKVQSCGCILSKKEELLIKIFTEHNINFIHQYSFPDLLSDKGNKLRFDFGIIRNDKLVGLIEYNGEQHYSCAPRGYFTEENLERIRQHDALKIKYCNEHKIPLLILNKDNDLEESLKWIQQLP